MPSSLAGSRVRHATFALCIAVFLLFVVASPSGATTLTGTSLGDLSAGAATIVRGECLRADVEMTDVAGGRVAVTRYTFRVDDTLKGATGAILTFRQVGTPERGTLDLGRLAGLPVFETGTEYVLFLLPESPLGLTSPSGAGEGAFVVRGDQVISMRGTPRQTDPAPSAADAGTATEYAKFREAVLREAGR